MSKRFRDTELWGKEWFVALTCAERCAIDYILCRCDPVGVWPPAFSVAERLIGESVDWEALPDKTNGNIKVLPSGKWWLVDYCKYQYGKRVRPSEGAENKTRREQTMHDHIYSLLRSHDLWDDYLATVGGTVQVEVEEEVKEEKIKREVAPGVLLSTSENLKLIAKYGTDATKAAYAKLSSAKLAHGYKYKSDYGAILHWVMDEVVKKAKGEGVRAPTPGWVCKACGATNHNTGGVCVCGEVRE